VAEVSRSFSTAFERERCGLLIELFDLGLIGISGRVDLGMGCLGEVRVSEQEDYDKWGIDILVSFRDNEEMQLLTGQRQSGGVSYEEIVTKEKRLILHVAMWRRNGPWRLSCT
jgi:hypothetical protein